MAVRKLKFPLIVSQLDHTVELLLEVFEVREKTLPTSSQRNQPKIPDPAAARDAFFLKVRVLEKIYCHYGENQNLVIKM